MWRKVFFVCGIMSCCGVRCSPLATASTLPTALQLESAIVAAVEDDVEQQHEEELQYSLDESTAHQNEAMLQEFNNNPEMKALKRLVNEFVEGRGRFRKRRKMLKYLYPLLIGILIVKTVLLPLTLKALAALSTSSFVMSKIALAAAGLITLKWLLVGGSGGGGGSWGAYNGAKERTHLEILHLPAFTRSYYKGVVGGGGGGGGGSGGWDDLSYSGSGLLHVKAKQRHQQQQQQQQYIPLGSMKDEAFVADANVALGGYRYSLPQQHNYDAATFDGKPFL